MSWVKRKVLVPIRIASRKGQTMQRISTAIAIGLVIGVIPFYGITTLLAFGIALSFRLNVVLVQAAHFIVHPLQLFLMLPFFKMGGLIFTKEAVSFSIKGYIESLKLDFWGGLGQLWQVQVSAIVVWAVLAVPMFFLLYNGISYLLNRYSRILFRRSFGTC